MSNDGLLIIADRSFEIGELLRVNNIICPLERNHSDYNLFANEKISFLELKKAYNDEMLHDLANFDNVIIALHGNMGLSGQEDMHFVADGQPTGKLLWDIQTQLAAKRIVISSCYAGLIRNYLVPPQEGELAIVIVGNEKDRIFSDKFKLVVALAARCFELDAELMLEEFILELIWREPIEISLIRLDSEKLPSLLLASVADHDVMVDMPINVEDWQLFFAKARKFVKNNDDFMGLLESINEAAESLHEDDLKSYKVQCFLNSLSSNNIEVINKFIAADIVNFALYLGYNPLPYLSLNEHASSREIFDKLIAYNPGHFSQEAALFLALATYLNCNNLHLAEHCLAYIKDNIPNAREKEVYLIELDQTINIGEIDKLIAAGKITVNQISKFMRKGTNRKGEAFISLPITPGDDPNLLQGGYSVTTTPNGLRELSEQREVVGPGASQDLQNEITARNGQFVRIPADGNIQEMQGDDPIAFAHMSAFEPESKGYISAFNREELGLNLQKMLGGHIGSMTAKLTGATFEALQVRTPNHNCSPAPHIAEALKEQVYFFFLHDPNIAKNTRLHFADLENLSQLELDELGFVKDEDKQVYIRKVKDSSAYEASATVQEVEVNDIIIRAGDQLFIHQEPLAMTTVIQYARDDIFEMGGAAGWHMHTDGVINIEGEDIQVGGHILGFVGLQNAFAQAMRVTNTRVQESENWRDAWGVANLGMEIAERALEEQDEIAQRLKKESVANVITACDYQSDHKNLWSSYVRNQEQRVAQTTNLVARTKEYISMKDQIVNEIAESYGKDR